MEGLGNAQTSRHRDSTSMTPGAIKMINQKEGHSCWETRLHFLAHAGHHQRVRKLGQALALRVKRALNAAQALAQRALRGADGGDGSHHLNGERGGGGSSKRAPASKAT